MAILIKLYTFIQRFYQGVKNGPARDESKIWKTVKEKHIPKGLFRIRVENISFSLLSIFVAHILLLNIVQHRYGDHFPGRRRRVQDLHRLI